MNLDLDSILWSTRGYDWGFRFLIQPQKYGKYCQDWLGHYEKMFEQFSDDEIRVVTGYLKIDTKEISYIAIRFKDPELRKDISGRVIPHEVAIVGDDIEELKNLSTVDLRIFVWDLLSDTYREAYQSSSQEISKKQDFIENKESTNVSRHKKYQWQELNPKLAISVAIALLFVIGLAYAAGQNFVHQSSPPRSLSK